MAVDVFGGMSKKSGNVLQVLASNDRIKLDPDINNTITLSANGSLGIGVKSTGGRITGDISMGTNKIVELNGEYPPSHHSQAVSWGQVQTLVEELDLFYWDLRGNTVKENVKIGTLNNFNVYFIRHKQEYFSLRQNRITIKKEIDMSDCKIYNLFDPINPQDAVNKRYVDVCIRDAVHDSTRKIKNTSGFIPPLHNNTSKSGFIITTNSSESKRTSEGWTVFSPMSYEWKTDGINTSAWVQIKLPFPIAIWGFSLTGGLEGEKWFNWIVEASNDVINWKILHTGVNDMLGYETKF